MATTTVIPLCPQCQCQSFKEIVHTQNISLKDIYWVTGLLEGEGHFCSSKRTPIIVLSMTDCDVVTRAAQLLRGAVHCHEDRASKGWKPIYRLMISGAHAAAWLMMMLPLLGWRRRQQALAPLARWRSAIGRKCRCLQDNKFLCIHCYNQEQKIIKKLRNRHAPSMDFIEIMHSIPWTEQQIYRITQHCRHS